MCRLPSVWTNFEGWKSQKFLDHLDENILVQVLRNSIGDQPFTGRVFLPRRLARTIPPSTNVAGPPWCLVGWTTKQYQRNQAQYITQFSYKYTNYHPFYHLSKHKNGSQPMTSANSKKSSRKQRLSISNIEKIAETLSCQVVFHSHWSTIRRHGNPSRHTVLESKAIGFICPDWQALRVKHAETQTFKMSNLMQTLDAWTTWWSNYGTFFIWIFDQ